MSDYLPVFSDAVHEAEIRALYQKALDCWSAPYTEVMVQTRFGDTHVIASGPEMAPPIILLHAFFASAVAWYPIVGELSQHHRVYAVDVLGEANLSRPKKPILTIEDLTAWFCELLDGLGIQQTDLVGNSNGGFLSATYALRVPERIRRIVLISPAATFHQIIPFFVNMFFPVALKMFFPKLPGHATRIKHGVEWMYAGLPADPIWNELFQRYLQFGSGAGGLFPKVYSKKDFELVKAPTLLLVGDHEKVYRPDAVFKKARQLLPGIQTGLVPDAHHIAALSQPTAVSKFILDFLDI